MDEAPDANVKPEAPDEDELDANDAAVAEDRAYLAKFPDEIKAAVVRHLAKAFTEAQLRRIDNVEEVERRCVAKLPPELKGDSVVFDEEMAELRMAVKTL